MNKKGFTLVEVLVAIIILTIGILAIWKMHIASIRSNVFIYNLQRATNIANEKIEEIRDILTEEDLSSISAGEENIDNKFRCEWSFSDGPLNTKEMNVTVGWGGDNCLLSVLNCEHKVNMVTFMRELRKR